VCVFGMAYFCMFCCVTHYCNVVAKENGIVEMV